MDSEIPENQESKEIKDFFEKVLFSGPVRKYFLNALASCLNGENKDQKLFICNFITICCVH